MAPTSPAGAMFLSAAGFDVPEIVFHLGARPDGAAGLLELR